MIKNNGTKKCVVDVETTGFDPWTGRIICIGIMDVDTEQVEIFYDSYEEALLLKFFSYFEKNGYQEVIGYNLGFDFRWLLGRALFYKIPSANAFYNAKSTDVMQLLRGTKRYFKFDRAGTLDEWSRFLLGKGKLLKSGSIPALYRAGKISEIIAYNKQDLSLTCELYQLWNDVFGLGGANHGSI
jgi:DNA polymerase III epsilon subunit-like protein